MQIFIQAAEKIGQIAVEAVKLELARQGHNLTGSLIDSVEYKVRQTATGAIIEGYMNDYGIPVNTGVTAANIPYKRGSGGKSSKYIDGLTLFAKLKFKVPQQEAQRIAFAIANKHKKEGMPTQSSKRFSKTGKRTGAIQDALDNADDKIQAIINEVIAQYIEIIFIEAFTSNIPDVKIR